jgi:hypothetical protein
MVIVGNAYRVKDPGGTVPGWSIENGPQVEEEHGRDTTAAQGIALVVLRLGDFDVCTNNPQADGTSGCTDEQQVAATDAVN